MPERNTPQKTLESWKQIAAYLDRSERTVRRWEMSEGLPVHRREHEKQDTVFAYKYELDAWSVPAKLCLIKLKRYRRTNPRTTPTSPNTTQSLARSIAI